MPRKKKEITQDIAADSPSVLKAGKKMQLFADEEMTKAICTVDKGTELRLDHLVWDKAFVYFGNVAGWCDALGLASD